MEDLERLRAEALDLVEQAAAANGWERQLLIEKALNLHRRANSLELQREEPPRAE